MLQGYTTYAAVVYVMTAIIGCCLLACGWVAFKFNKNGVVPNKWSVRRRYSSENLRMPGYSSRCCLKQQLLQQ